MILSDNNVAGRGVWRGKTPTVLDTLMDFSPGCSIDSYGNDDWLVQCIILGFRGQPRMGVQFRGRE